MTRATRGGELPPCEYRKNGSGATVRELPRKAHACNYIYAKFWNANVVASDVDGRRSVPRRHLDRRYVAATNDCLGLLAALHARERTERR